MALTIDEVEKVVAAREYEYLRGNIHVDQKHPMPFKLLLASAFWLFGERKGIARGLVAFWGCSTILLSTG